MTQGNFLDVIHSQLRLFSSTRTLQRLDSGEFTLRDYHSILLTIFHQTYESPSTFSLAASMIESSRFEVKSYLTRHAEEEKLHWQWIIGDLGNTGYTGPDPRTLPHGPAVAGYIGYNHYIALKYPIGRLAIAAMLESIGAAFGARYSTRVMDVLGLQADQVVFFRGHGDTDVGHTREIVEVLEKAELSSSEWSAMSNIAETAAVLYRAMYQG